MTLRHMILYILPGIHLGQYHIFKGTLFFELPLKKHIEIAKKKINNSKIFDFDYLRFIFLEN